MNYFSHLLQKNITLLEKNIQFYIETYALNIVWAVIVIILWLLISIIVYRFIIYLFKRFRILELINKFDITIHEDEELKQEKKIRAQNKSEVYELITKKIQIDKVVNNYFMNYNCWTIFKRFIDLFTKFICMSSCLIFWYKIC